MSFEIVALSVFTLWAVGLILFLAPSFFLYQKKISEGIIISGTLLLLSFIIHIWIRLGRAPMRTLGETRLWYSFFLASIGLVIFYKWKIRWMVVYSLVLSGLFLSINLLHPENFEKALMPALQSYWFVPHVIVYIFAYALLGASMIIAVYGLYQYYKKEKDPLLIENADNIVYTGFSFLTFGLLFGALWAKEAWGHYWTWDPKETWAFITWMIYLLYIHYRFHRRLNTLRALWILALAFVVLLVCWFGINYLPSAQNSVHTYTR